MIRVTSRSDIGQFVRMNAIEPLGLTVYSLLSWITSST